MSETSRRKISTVTLTNEKLHIALGPIQALSRKELPTKAAYNLSRTLEAVEAEIKAVQSQREKILQKYQKKDGEKFLWKERKNPETQEMEATNQPIFKSEADEEK